MKYSRMDHSNEDDTDDEELEKAMSFLKLELLSEITNYLTAKLERIRTGQISSRREPMPLKAMR